MFTHYVTTWMLIAIISFLCVHAFRTQERFTKLTTQLEQNHKLLNKIETKL